MERKDHAVREEGEVSGTVEAAAVVALLSCLQAQFAEPKKKTYEGFCVNDVTTIHVRHSTCSVHNFSSLCTDAHGSP